MLHVRLWPLSMVLLIIFMDRISRRSQGPMGVQLGSHMISSLLFADDVILFASSNQEPQISSGVWCCWAENQHLHVQGHFSRPKRGPASSGGVSLGSRVRERWSMRLTGKAVQPLQLCGQGIVVKQELSQKAKISIWQGDWVLPKRWGEKFSLGGAQRTASAPLRRKDSAEVARTPVPHTWGHLQACPARGGPKEDSGHTQTPRNTPGTAGGSL